MNYYIITYGCQMNKLDSERIASVLESRGYSPASKENEADLIVVNMCSVRQSAVDRVFGLCQKLAKLKTQNSKLKTVLTGCILKLDRKKFREKFDEIWNTRNYFDVQSKCKYKPIAYVPISNGCNHFCTYCVVPFTRGPLVCRPAEEILDEVKNLVRNGYKEIWLLGQNVNDYTSRIISESKANNKRIEKFASYSLPISFLLARNNEVNFARLLKMVNNIPGDFSIRFISPHPADFTDELIDTMAKCEKVAKFLNLPVQSGDNEILKKMNRPYTVEQYRNLVKKIREKIPDINLSTDVIVGFPSETKKQFESTVKLFKEIKFDMAYIAKYSPRPGTAAFKLKNNVPLEEKKRRYKVLNDLLQNLKRPSV